MPKPPLPQRTQANACFAILRPALEEGVTQAQVARNHDLPKSTVQRWVKNYREKGLAGLANADRGMLLFPSFVVFSKIPFLFLIGLVMGMKHCLKTIYAV